MEPALEELVGHGDVLATVKTLHGQHANLVKFHVHPATSSVQGFLSLILRVTATVQTPDDRVFDSTFIVKRLPVMKEQLELIQDSDFFDQEIQFFKKAIPLLRKKNPSLSIVKCIAAYNNTIIMEDLSATGFQTVSASMKDVGNSLQIAHVRMAVRKLAEFHAASLDIDWLHELPFLNIDGLFEGHGRKLMQSYFITGCEALVKVQMELYPDLDEKYRKWLLGSECYEKSISYIKPSSKYLNVLCHGDFWENNMMFKSHPTNKSPSDIKFIDLQLVRYAPATTDLFYFLYLCTDKQFRDEHMEDILETYTTAFNVAACETPDRINVASLRREWEECRLFGALLAAVMKPIFLFETVFPGQDEVMTKEQLDQVMFGVDPDTVLQEFRANSVFSAEIKEMLDELIFEMDSAAIV